MLPVLCENRSIMQNALSFLYSIGEVWNLRNQYNYKYNRQQTAFFVNDIFSNIALKTFWQRCENVINKLLSESERDIIIVFSGCLPMLIKASCPQKSAIWHKAVVTPSLLCPTDIALYLHDDGQNITSFSMSFVTLRNGNPNCTTALSWWELEPLWACASFLDTW